ncbi:vacuolar iron transporter (VIT) family protein [Actinidia rufa]|uniref:Vacuolar iron transporter n=1 Tax=Actinidia rufa TaxID=165716 RepID=A0A7J0DKX0_9ERIC|nr:vacuolar iron transporter (VIT) family protein [Actinidia rufa]
MTTSNDVHIPIPKPETEQNCQEHDETEFDYSQRAQWLRAAVLGANDGHGPYGLCRASCRGMCSMAIGEFVSVYSQLDIEVAQMKRERRKSGDKEETETDNLPNPVQAAIASALAFTLGAIVPLLAAAFIRDHKVRLGVVVVAVSVALVVFGGVGAVLGRTPVVKSGTRVVVGGWMAMAITYGLTKLIGSSGLQM